MSKASRVICISCSVFCKELNMLQGELDLECHCLDSDLHLRPRELQERMTPLVESAREQSQVLLIYGDCHPYMTELERPGVVRTRGVNCAEIILGKNRYRELVRAGAFFILPEWALRWREIFAICPGFDMAEIIRDMHSKLVYLDTGTSPVPHQELQACSQWCGIPYEVLSVSLDNFLNVVNDAITKLQTRRDHDELAI